MNKVITDGIGHKISVGDNVIYNYSGELRDGVVTKIYESWRQYPYIKGQFYFSGYFTIRNDRNNVDSKVRNMKCIIVIPSKLS